jgi:hypothetical protein
MCLMQGTLDIKNSSSGQEPLLLSGYEERDR